MSLVADLKTIAHMAFSAGRGNTHAERLENFYHGQAQSYDNFRRRLLQGRHELYQQLPTPQDGVWIEMGGGTGANLEALGNRIQQLKQVYVVDLCPSLLGVARQRIARQGWDNVTTVEADVTTFVPPEGQAQVVTFSYSLTMIPNWQAALDQAQRLLTPGGRIGVVDFFSSPARWNLPLNCHSQLSRWFWPRWFAQDHVYLNPAHPQTLTDQFQTIYLSSHHARVPYLPGLKVPYYQFIGC